MKKLTALLLALVMVLSLTACGSGSGTQNKDNGGDKQQTQTDNKNNNTNTDKDNKEEPTGEYVEKDGFMQLNGKLPNSVTDMVVTQLKTDKANYEDGEEIVVTIKWTGTPAEDAWLGFFPADVPHGDEEVNDGRYFNWIPLSHAEDNKITLNAARTDDRSQYTIRVFENDNGGAEVAWCTVTVK